MRSLQLEKGGGITAGNLLLFVPGRLAAYAEEIVGLGRLGKLPPTSEMHTRVDEFARDEGMDGRHVSIPLDLLYSTTADDALHARILVRAKAPPEARADLRRRSLYLRYFLRKAFRGFQPGQLDIKLAFYLDAPSAHVPWSGTDSLFNQDEWIDRDRFWNELCPGAQPEALFAEIRKSATQALENKDVVGKLKNHFARARKEGADRHQQER